MNRLFTARTASLLALGAAALSGYALPNSALAQAPAEGGVYIAGYGFTFARAAEQGNAAAHCGLARLYSGAEGGYRRDPPAAATHAYVARALGKDCGLTDFGASATLAKWTADEGVRRGKERVAKGFARRPLK